MPRSGKSGKDYGTVSDRRRQKKRELNAARASELDPLAAKDNTRTTGKMCMGSEDWMPVTPLFNFLILMVVWW